MINAKLSIGTGFPDQEGTRLADVFLATPPEEGEPRIDVREVPPGLLISAFFFAFYDRVREACPNRLAEALRTRWDARFDFQAESIERFRRAFEERAGRPGVACAEGAAMREREDPQPRERVFRSTRSADGPDAHRDMDGFDPDEELARMRLALRDRGEEARAFALEAAENLDEYITRGGPLPRAWQRTAMGALRDFFKSNAARIGRTRPRIQDLWPLEEMPSPPPLFYMYRDCTAFTVGNADVYDRRMDDPAFCKKGRDGEYAGGWVWKTPEEARAFLSSPKGRYLTESPDPSSRYEVYELEMPDVWEACVSKEPAGDGVHRLLVDSRIVAKVAP